MAKEESAGGSIAPVSFARMLGRAVRLRCPRCGGRRAWIRGWFGRLDRCRTCGYRYERQEGFMLGSLTVNTILTFGAILAVVVVGMVVTYPDIAVVPVVLACIAVAVLVPLLVYPFTSTIWGAIDLAMHPLQPAEVADASAALRREPAGDT
jgi:uncharacterized protein (DUF983 family)